MKSFKELFKEAEETADPTIEDNFDFPGLPPPEASIKDPNFIFEVRGIFDVKQLQKFVNENKTGLDADKYFIKINTIGTVTDSEYEEFVDYVEKSFPLIKFEE